MNSNKEVRIYETASGWHWQVGERRSFMVYSTEASARHGAEFVAKHS